ncbi:hypothetical protein ACWC5I_21070 [Kitasatospora sp. NPDC001574]
MDEGQPGAGRRAVHWTAVGVVTGSVSALIGLLAWLFPTNGVHVVDPRPTEAAPSSADRTGAAPAPSAPPGGSTPTAAPALPSSPWAGTWRATVTDRTGTYPIVVTLWDSRIGETFGKIEYPVQGCLGSWTLLETSPDSRRGHETISRQGAARECAASADLLLTRQDDGSLTLTWTGFPARGVLYRD